MSIVIHEVEKGIGELVEAVKGDDFERINNFITHLSELIDSLESLLRKSRVKQEKASLLIRQVCFNLELRLNRANINVEQNIDHGDFEVRCSRRLIVGTLMNLLDNSIWWLDNRWGDVSGKKYIYIGTSFDLSAGPAIVVADNGPGFIDPLELLVEPFVSRKPDGIGLGLYIANEVMKVHSGSWHFRRQAISVYLKKYDGAVIALVFGG